MKRKTIFKICPLCKKEWILREDLLYDPAVTLLGYQMHFLELNKGLFYFNHDTGDCGTTFALLVEEFADLYEGPFYTELKLGDEDCPLYCLRRSEKRSCGTPCEAAYVRELMSIIDTIQAQVQQKESATQLST